MEHPFFVYGQGWASCAPDRTLLVYGLKVHRLQVGDVLISLTPREPASPSPARGYTIITTATTTAVTARQISASSNNHNHNGASSLGDHRTAHMHTQLPVTTSSYGSHPKQLYHNVSHAVVGIYILLFYGYIQVFEIAKHLFQICIPKKCTHFFCKYVYENLFSFPKEYLFKHCTYICCFPPLSGVHLNVYLLDWSTVKFLV